MTCAALPGLRTSFLVGRCRLNLFTAAEEAQYLRTISGQLSARESHTPSSGAMAASTPAAVPASVVLALQPAPEPGDTATSKIAAAASVGCARTPRSSPGGHSGSKIIFLAMTLAWLTRRWLGCSRLLATQAVAPALCPPLLLTSFRLAITMSRLPRPPSACLFATFLAAVARQRMDRSESPLASFQQARPTPWMSRSPPWPCRVAMASLIFPGG